MVKLKGSNPICYCLVDALIRNILLLCQQSRTQEIHSYTHTIFFFLSMPHFFWNRTLHGPSHSLFGFYRILPRVVSIALNPSYKSFPFQRFFSLLPFASFPLFLLLSFSLKLFCVFLRWPSRVHQIYLHGIFLRQLFIQHGVSVYSLEPRYLFSRIHALTSAAWLQEWLVLNFFIFFLQS